MPPVNTIDTHCNLFALIEGTACPTPSAYTVLYFPGSYLLGVTAMKHYTDWLRHRRVSLTLQSEHLRCLQAKPANLSSICSRVVP